MNAIEAQHNFTFDDATHIYRLDGVVLPSVTQVLTELGFLSTEWVTPQALYRGKYVHQAIHYLNEGDYDINDCLPEYRGFVNSWIKFRDYYGVRIKILAAEKRGYHHIFNYAGTLDLWCQIDNLEWVIDFKTVGKGCHAPKAAKFQTAAYDILLPAYYGRGLIRKRACLELHEDGSMPTLIPHDDLDDGQHFLCFLDTFNQRRLHGINKGI